MTRTLSTIQEIQKELDSLSEKKSLAQAQRVILSVIRLLDDSVSVDDTKNFELFNVDNQKISANAQWFYEDAVVVDRRATYKIHAQNSLNIDFKLYGLTKPSKRTISWIQALTPNFEDEPFNSKYNLGIDFVVPKSADRIIIVLSNSYVIRTLELKGALTATYQEIFSKWASISDFSNKKEVHSILWESFDLQPLNKKFYAGISERFITLRQHLTKEDVLDEKHASLFANRLLGRVIFCWFLDKKGIINADKKYFDSESFESDNEYYKTKLENLFFGVLNTPIPDREYKDEVTPFLNGGLFEARDTDLYKSTKLTFPKNYFDDLFGFLSAYNFTTDESTSQFQQVAIDPEMLGRIFENLLAEMTEEDGGQARKAKGAFYTPREIVDYMCRESLKEYLKTKLPEDEHRDQRLEQLIDRPDKEFQDQDHNWRRDWKPYKEAIIDALDELKVLDPACGSGAFPIGMLQLLVKVYERLEARFDPYKTKLQIIEKNIYGVDIEPMAVEIARLRTWLSIIVDEEADSKKIKPLPNLEFKFVCANSLIDLDKSGISAFGDDPELENKLKDIRDAYFNTGSLNKKKKLRDDYDKLVKTNPNMFGESEKSLQLKTYRPFDNETTASFFNSEFMFGILRFNVIIGNPPYIKNTRIDKLLKEKYITNYTATFDQWDIYVLFFEFSYNLLEEKGVCCLITANQWLSAKFGLKLRSILAPHILSFTDFKKYSDFDGASVNTFITLFSKEEKRTSLSITDFNNHGLSTTRLVSRSDVVDSATNLGLLLSTSLEVIKSVKQRFKKTFSDYYKIGHSFSIPDFYKLSNLISEEVNFDPKTDIKLVSTGTLSLLGEYYGVKKFKYDGHNYNKPIVKRVDFLKLFPTREIQTLPKLIIASMGGLNIGLDLDGHFLGTRPTVWIHNKSQDELKIAFGLLSSTFIKWFYYQQYSIAGMAGFKLKYGDIKETPFPEIDNTQRIALLDIVNQLIGAIRGKSEKDVLVYKQSLNNFVMDLYRLTDEEKKIIYDSESK